MTGEVKGDLCYFLYGPQNAKDQMEKRLDDLYCYAQNRYIIKCPKKKCEYYYSVDEWIVDYGFGPPYPE